MKEISIEADQVKRSTISDLRTAAQNEGIFWDETLTPSDKISEENTEEPTAQKDKLFWNIQEKYICIISDDTLTIKLAKNTPKETLLDIKSLLESYSPGKYHVWLDIGGQIIDTKKNINGR